MEETEDKIEKFYRPFRRIWILAIFGILISPIIYFHDSIEAIEFFYEKGKGIWNPLSQDENQGDDETMFYTERDSKIYKLINIDTLHLNGYVDIYNLLDTFNNNEFYWDFQSNNPNILWITNSQGDADVERIGYLILSSNDQPLYTALRLRRDPGLWEISLVGSHASPDKLRLKASYFCEYSLYADLESRNYNVKLIDTGRIGYDDIDYEDGFMVYADAPYKEFTLTNNNKVITIKEILLLGGSWASVAFEIY